MDTSDLRKSILHRVFALPPSDNEAYHTLRLKLDAALAAHAQDEAKRSAIYKDMTSQLKAHLPDLVTFNPSPVDQEPWERAAQPTLSEDRESADVDFFTLICTFLNHVTIDSMVSPSLLSQEPDAAKALVDFRGAIVPLMTGLPRTIPWPQLPKAHIDRRQLMTRVKPFMRAVTLAAEDEDPGPEYRDLMDGLETVKPLLTDRQKIFSNPVGQQLSSQTISADFAHLLWTLCTPNALCFWMLVHLYASKDDTLTRLREEVQQFASAVQPEGIFGFSVSPAVQLDIPGLLQGCPILESCWLETIRLYGRGLYSWTARDRVVIPDASSPFTKPNAYIVEQGDRVVSPSWAANLNETRWKIPDQWQGDRHLDRESDSPLRVDQRCKFESFSVNHYNPANFVQKWVSLGLTPQQSPSPKDYVYPSLRHSSPCGIFRLSTTRLPSAFLPRGLQPASPYRVPLYELDYADARFPKQRTTSERMR